jgi:hypothetical protein
MNLKAPKTLAMLAAIIAVLLMGTVLISGCSDTGAAKADADSQIIQASAYPADSDKPCDAAKKEVKTCSFKSNNPGHEATKEAKACPPECEKACCEAKKEAKTCPKMTGEKANPSECPMKSHPKTKGTKAHSTEQTKHCSK